MPTVIEAIISPFNATTQVKENIVDMIDAIDRREIPFLNLLGWPLDGGILDAMDSLKFPCTQATHTWISDQLIPNTTLLTAAYAAGGVTISVTAGTAQYFVVDEIIVSTSGNVTTSWRITNIDATNDILTVVLIAGDGTHAIGDSIFSMGRPAVRGEQFATVGRVTTQVTDTNYTQIFGAGKEGVIAISGTDQATQQYGITNRLDYETGKKLQELAIRLEQAAMYGERLLGSTANDQPASRMGGVFYYLVRLAGGQVENGNGDQLNSTEIHIKNLLDAVWGQGGKPSVLLMNTYQRRSLSDRLAPFVRTGRDERVLGVVTDMYEYSHGILNVALSKWVHPPHVFMLDPTMIGLGPLRSDAESRAFVREDVPKTGDYHIRAVYGEYTLELHNRTAGHGIITNLAIA